MSKELTDFINEHILKKRFNSNASKEIFWKNKNALHLLDELNNYSHGSLQQKTYNYINNTTDTHICEMCDNEVKFISYNKGYSSFCSQSCVQKSDKTRKKYKQSMLKKYGYESNLSNDVKKQSMLKKYDVENPQQLTEVKDKVKKTKLQKYGDENYNNTEKMKETKLQKYGDENYVNSEKIKETMLKRYGYESNLSNDVKKKFMLKKYGVENPSQLESTQQKKKENALIKYGVNFQAKHITKENYELLNDKDYLSRTSIIDIMKQTNSSQTLVSRRMIEHEINTGLRSSGELSVLNFIKSFYNGEILTNKRKMFGTEIDIYIPEFNFGIEYNGVYYHSDKFRRTHKDKFDIMSKRGDYLLQIFDYEWENTTLRKIFESMIKIKMNNHKRKISSDKCEIKNVSSNEAKEFLNNNHIKGYIKSSIRKGLYYNNELVQIMTFRKSKDKLELLRFVTIKDTIIEGYELFKSVKNLNIIAYSDNFYSDDNIYKELGFTKLNTIMGHFYVKDKIRVNMFKKHKLKDMFNNVDMNLTVSEIVKMNGYYRIFDAGITKWEYNEFNRLHK